MYNYVIPLCLPMLCMFKAQMFIMHAFILYNGCSIKLKNLFYSVWNYNNFGYSEYNIRDFTGFVEFTL